MDADSICAAFFRGHGVAEIDDDMALEWACQNGGEAVKTMQVCMAEMGLVGNEPLPWDMMTAHSRI